MNTALSFADLIDSLPNELIEEIIPYVRKSFENIDTLRFIQVYENFIDKVLKGHVIPCFFDTSILPDIFDYPIRIAINFAKNFTVINNDVSINSNSILLILKNWKSNINRVKSYYYDHDTLYLDMSWEFVGIIDNTVYIYFKCIDQQINTKTSCEIIINSNWRHFCNRLPQKAKNNLSNNQF